MDYLNTLSGALQVVLTYLANGFLTLVYALGKISPALLSIAAAGAVLVLLDRPVQSRISFRPGRANLSARPVLERSFSGILTSTFPRGQSHTSQYLTLTVLVLWLAAQFGMAAPIPWIGAGMWALGLVVLLAIPEHQRSNLLWFVKCGIAVYALLVLFFRLYLGYTSTIAVQEWARWIGSSAATSQVITTTRSNVISLLLWILWFIAPLGYVSLLIQQLLVNPINLASPRAGAEELIRRLRQRS